MPNSFAIMQFKLYNTSSNNRDSPYPSWYNVIPQQSALLLQAHDEVMWNCSINLQDILIVILHATQHSCYHSVSPQVCTVACYSCVCCHIKCYLPSYPSYLNSLHPLILTTKVWRGTEHRLLEQEVFLDRISS